MLLPMVNGNYNPDVLNCIANLSNDEVFTPPELANKVLDLLPPELFKSPDTKFMDPFTKSGVFLREIVKRLDRGLEALMPDRQLRIDHILHNQVFGIAITELTSYLSRRSVYCSKHADGKYSVSRFNTESGNILYANRSHTWENGKCKYCGASQQVYDRGSEAEQYAYMFIHTDNPKQFFGNMKFDVIVGNPPYQLNDGGGTGSSAMPIYNKFIQQAKKLKPRYLSMIVPARWFSGGRGLDDFRDEMLHDRHLRVIHDHIDANDCFPGVEIKGGVCYFLWERDQLGDCHIYTHTPKGTTSSIRPLLEPGAEVFIRHNDAISILRKISLKKEESFSSIVSANDPFGFDVREGNSYKRVKPDYSLEKSKGSVEFYYNGWRKEGLGYIHRSRICKNIDFVDRCKLYIPKAWGTGSGETDWLKPFLCNHPSCCTETYLLVGPFDNPKIANNALSYTQTKFFHCLTLLIKNTQNAMKKVYSFVPLQDFSHPWTDEMLYKKYGLTEDEIAFIESMIRPME